MSTPAMSLGASFLSALAASGAAQAGQSGYKALVCIFLEGGNDHWNTVVPYDAESYGKYAEIRGGKIQNDYSGIGVRWDALKALSPRAGSRDPFQHALHPELESIAAMFNGTFGKTQRRLASVALNIGPLSKPIDDLNDLKSSSNLPRRLFSHNDQQALTQSITGTEGARSGWAGRVMDTLEQRPAIEGIAVGHTPNAVLLSGSLGAFGVSVGVDAPPGKPVFTDSEWDCYSKMLDARRYKHPLMKDLCLVNTRTLTMVETLADQVATGSEMDRYFPGSDSHGDDADSNPLVARLRMVARLIYANRNSNQSQVFLVSLGGFDNHSGLTDRHPRLLRQLDQAVGLFFTALEAEGCLEKVTAFTASEFGRTLWSNGNGSDHGWGAHHFVLSGDPSFLGGHFVGNAPDIRRWTRANSDAGKGRLIPTTSLEQFAYPLARWLGVSESDAMNHVFPKLGDGTFSRPITLFDASKRYTGPA